MKIFSRSSLHEHEDPAQRLQGVAVLPPDSGELARLLTADPAPEVRSAAAQRCSELPALAEALTTESDPAVRAAVATALGTVASETADANAATAFLAGEACTDAVRAEVACRTADPERRRVALSHIRDEALLVDVALSADLAETRQEAAGRVTTPEGLRKMAEAAKNKDRGVARLARHRIDAIEERESKEKAADALIEQLVALAAKPGPILSAVVDIDHRWHALGLAGDDVRRARWDAGRAVVQARFDREREEHRVRTQFDRRLREWIDALQPPTDAGGFELKRGELAALRDIAKSHDDANALSMLDEAEARLAGWARERDAAAGAEALVVEAEKLAADTSIDNAGLPERWSALDRSMRTPALTQRFEAALIVIEQRRLAQVQVAQQAATQARTHVHSLLHTAEQALAAGQLHAARAAADEIRTAKASAGSLPKPTIQRVSRLVQQLTELERWESFGQRQAREQLCQRAEALLVPGMDAPRLAAEVQKLRNEWKALDQQHAGVPKAVWERFDSACEKAYAPAARHFAEMAAQRKEARRKRDEFIAAATTHAPTLLAAEPRDLRAIERWLRETDKTWREGDLGSVEPGAWKKLDARLKAALLPLREALSTARDSAKAGRKALIAEVTALGSKALDRDAPSQVKAIQAKWQAEAKAKPLGQRDERALWEEFRAACDAVFTARNAKRKEVDERRQGKERAVEEVVLTLERLKDAADKDDAEVRRALRDAQDQWKQRTGRADAPRPAMEARFRNAKSAVETMLSSRGRSREAAVWQTLAAKERLCDELDRSVLDGAGAPEATSEGAVHGEVASTGEVIGTANEPTVLASWAALPALPTASEQKMAARRDAALSALADAAAAAKHRKRIEEGAAPRREWLLELEMMLKLDSPSEMQALRLALQVRQLKERFGSATTGGAKTPEDLILQWCAQPGVANAGERQRRDRVFAAIAKGG
jgi:hypothetical protein